MIKFHGDNKLLSEFVIMGDRSNNAILKGVLLSWPLKWKGVRYGYRMVFVMIWKYASSLFIFARTNSDQIYLESSRSTLENADSKQRKICKSCACRMFFLIKGNVLRQVTLVTGQNFASKSNRAFMRFLRAVWAKAKFCKHLSGTICAIPLLLLLVIFKAFASLLVIRRNCLL